MSLKINAIKVKQPIGYFYICKLNSSILARLSKADIYRISNNGDNLYEGIQRQLIPKKVKQITAYLKSKEATFPNSIILNVDKDHVISANDDSLILVDDESTFTIIDGQHRLEGLKNSNLTNFDVVLSIFVDLELNEQSRVFVTINTEQTKIDPSFGLYQELNDPLYTPRKMVVKLTELFNYDINSPWHKMIKLVGKKDALSTDGILSLSAFANPIINLVYDDSQFHDLRNLILQKYTVINENNIEEISDIKINKIDFFEIKKSCLWDYYVDQNEKMLYKVLMNYFKAVKETFVLDWANKESLLNKTTGYNALIKLFEDIYRSGYENGDFTQEYFKNALEPLKKLDGTINSKYFSPSGYFASNELYSRFTKEINY